MKISVCIPSYKRAGAQRTLKYLKGIREQLRVFVDPGEVGKYEELNPGAEIRACDPGIQGNVARVRNWILDREFLEKKADAVVLLDDDIRGIFRWADIERILVKPEEFFPFVEKYSILAAEWGAKLWGVNLYGDKQLSKEMNPFATLSPVLGPFQCFLDNAGGLRYDEAMAPKEDYDMFLQQVNIFRVAMRVNFYFYECLQSENPGGCAEFRTVEKEIRLLRSLQKKWGADIVRRGASPGAHNVKRKRGKWLDYNPMIKVPIKGV